MRIGGLTFRLILLIFTSTALLFTFLFFYSYRFSRRTIEEKAEENARYLVSSTVNLIESVLNPVAKVPETLALVLANNNIQQVHIYDLLIETVMRNPEIYGSAIAFEPYSYQPEEYFFAPYYYQSEYQVKMSYLGGEDYNYFIQDWYQIPKLLNQTIWSEPYYDEGGGNIIMSTYSVPLYRWEDRRRFFRGIVTADISLSWLREIVSSIRIYETGYGFLLSQNGTLITHPNSAYVMNESIFSLAEVREEPALREIGRRMIRGEEGFTILENSFFEDHTFLAYAPVPSSGWSLGIIFPREELLSEVSRLNRIVLTLATMFFIVLFASVLFISRSVTKPIRALAGATGEIAKGKLDIQLPLVRSNDEVGLLSASFTSMTQDLRAYIAHLKETTAAKERIESELQIAHEIQMSMIPKIFPPFPNRVEFELYAVMEPAREVGGDFYDFFFLDEDHLCFLIGDVSGKGVPAALFMAMTKTLIKAQTEKGIHPRDILQRLNQDLSEDNEASMFATIFCAVLDVRSGEILYSNGGHNPPALMRTGGRVMFETIDPGTVIGIVPDFSFPGGCIILSPGDAILLYTDGVSEAFDKQGNIFTEERLLKVLEGSLDNPPEKLVDTVVREIHMFSEGVEQSDDITLLALRYWGVGGKR